MVDHDEREESEEEQDPATKRLHQLKLILYGEADQESNPQKCMEVAQLLMQEKLIQRLITETIEEFPDSEEKRDQLYHIFRTKCLD